MEGVVGRGSLIRRDAVSVPRGDYFPQYAAEGPTAKAKLNPHGLRQEPRKGF